MSDPAIDAASGCAIAEGVLRHELVGRGQGRVMDRQHRAGGRRRGEHLAQPRRLFVGEEPVAAPGRVGVDEDQAQAIEVEHTIDWSAIARGLVHQLGAHRSSIVVVPRHVHDGYPEACRHWLDAAAQPAVFVRLAVVGEIAGSSITSKCRRPSATIRSDRSSWASVSTCPNSSSTAT